MWGKHLNEVCSKFAGVNESCSDIHALDAVYRDGPSEGI